MDHRYNSMGLGSVIYIYVWGGYILHFKGFVFLGNDSVEQTEKRLSNEFLNVHTQPFFSIFFI